MNSEYRHGPFTVHSLGTIDSTNSEAKRAVERLGASSDRAVFISSEQTAGRGRRGRTWLNTDGAVMMSIVIRAAMPIEELPLMNLAAALSVKRALSKLAGNDIFKVKWPNDVVSSRSLSKVCGILSEAVSLGEDVFAIIGVGVNVNASSIPEGLLQPATSLFIETGIKTETLRAAEAILDEFENVLELTGSDPERLITEFSNECVSLGHELLIMDGASVRCGTGLAIEPDGRLKVRFSNGIEASLYAADVSVRLGSAVDEALIKAVMPKRKPDGNKADNGRALLIVGSDDMQGAALMSTKACIRAGAGLTKVLVPEKLRSSFALIPEAMVITDDSKADELIAWADAVCIGCGMGVNERTALLLEKALSSHKPCVVDADALNTMSKRRGLMKLLGKNCVVTPHPGEMSRLCGCETAEIISDFTNKALAFSKEYGCITLLKNNVSAIASPQGALKYNTRGNSGLAKGGSGDVLAGLVTSMLAQGAEPFDAASIGAYLLGVSAEHAMELLRERFICAGDITDIVASELYPYSEEDVNGASEDIMENCTPSRGIAEKKAELRKAVRAARRELTEKERREASEAVSERLLGIPALRGKKTVLAYMPMKYELDVLPAVEKLKSTGVRAAFPLCIEDGGLRLFVPEDANGFVTGAYGILEPNIETAKEIFPEDLDAIILPAIGFDRQGRRLGQGGGYYDRLLSRCGCFTAAVGFDCQLLDLVPTEPTDRRVDDVVKPSETILI